MAKNLIDDSTFEFTEGADKASLEQVQQALSEAQGDITGIQGDITGIQNTLAMKGALLCEDDGTPPSLIGKVATGIHNYTLVWCAVPAADNILCIVSKESQYIRVRGVGIGNLSSTETVWNYQVNLTIDAANNAVANDQSTVTTQTGTSVTGPNRAYVQAIYGIL